MRSLAVGWVAIVVAVGWRGRPVARGRESELLGSSVVRSRPSLTSLVEDLGAWCIGRWGHLRPLRERTVGTLVVLAGTGMTVVGPPGPVLVLVGGAAWRARERRREVGAIDRRTDELGMVVDIVRLAISGGSGVATGLGIAHQYLPPGRSAGVGDVVRGIATGTPLDSALEAWEASQGPPVGELVSLLRAADQRGVAVSAALGELSRDLRRRRRRRIEERARRLPVTLLPPLVLCVLPAFVLVTVVPMVASGLDVLRSV